MSRIAILALGLAAMAAPLSAPASAGQYYHGGYAPYPPYGGYPTPCCAYRTPAPVVVVTPYGPPPHSYGGRTRLPPPPALNLSEGPRYHHYSGYGNVATPCYDQYVRVPDAHGGWAWGLKSGCDQR